MRPSSKDKKLKLWGNTQPKWNSISLIISLPGALRDYANANNSIFGEISVNEKYGNNRDATRPGLA